MIDDPPFFFYRPSLFVLRRPGDPDDPDGRHLRAELRTGVTLGRVDSHRGLIIPGLFSGFTCFLFRQYFLGFPKELEEAARVDGLSCRGAYWRVVVPNSMNFFAAMATITRRLVQGIAQTGIKG